MSGLTPAQKRTLHTAPCCGHLIANHDGAGCLACTNDGERDLDPCMESPATIETTYEAVAALVAAERDRLSAAMHADLADRMRAVRRAGKTAAAAADNWLRYFEAKERAR